MLGDWADDDDDEEFSHFAGAGASKSKSKGASGGSLGSGGSFMFVSSGVYDLASGKKQEEEASSSSAMQVDKSEPVVDAVPRKVKEAKETKRERELGRWEQHTKGLGSAMLKKMGWKQGKGLGIKEDGIIEPIKASVRVGGGGLEVKDESNASFRPKPAIEELEAKPEVQEEERKGKWKKDASKGNEAAAKPKVPKVVYKTREEYEREYGGGQKRQTVIDMRAPNLDTDAGLQVAALENQPAFMPELRHNLAHLVDLRVNGIHSLIRKKHYAETELKTLQTEESSLKHVIEGQKADISHLQVLKKRIELLKESSSDPSFDILDFFAELKDTFAEEYNRYRLESLIFHHVFPRINKEIKAWRPLEQPEFGWTQAMKWRQLLAEKEREALDDMEARGEVYDDGFGISSRLRKEQVKSSLNSLDTFNRMAYEVYVPKLRNALASYWNVYEPESALDLLYLWKKFLPRIGYNFLLYHVVQNRLKTAVAEYNPKSSASSTAGLPLDTWLLPWIQLMGTAQISPLLEEVRRKLQSAVSVVPSAADGVKLLLPFRGALDPQNWAQLMARSVLAKIESLLRQIEIDPSGQRMEEWQDALEWSSLVSPEAFGMALLESGFWKKWFSILGMWLRQEDVDFEQVQQWYSSWKQRFPKSIQTMPHVQPQFRSALRLMLAASDGDIPPLDQFIPAKIDSQTKQQPSSDQKASSSRPVWQEASLKELLEEAAEEAGTLFMATKRKQEGNPVFTFGRVPVYLDRDLIVAQLQPGSAWQPISIKQLIEHESSS